jgi:hypothetical protein
MAVLELDFERRAGKRFNDAADEAQRVFFDDGGQGLAALFTAAALASARRGNGSSFDLGVYGTVRTIPVHCERQSPRAFASRDEFARGGASWRRLPAPGAAHAKELPARGRGHGHRHVNQRDRFWDGGSGRRLHLGLRHQPRQIDQSRSQGAPINSIFGPGRHAQGGLGRLVQSRPSLLDRHVTNGDGTIWGRPVLEWSSRKNP